MSGSYNFALWSPHRDSREVILWKSLLSFRSEPWHWVEDSEQAHWHVVDVSRGVDPAWSEQLGGPRRIRGIALARQWLDLPSPAWTFFKVPLVPEDVHRWLNSELRLIGPNAFPEIPPSRPAPDPENPWKQQRLRLSRWPDVRRYGEDSISLTLACSMMLRDWTPYEQLIEVVPSSPPLLALLAEASQRGILQSAPNVAVPLPVASGAVVEEDNRWGLLKRIWNRFK